MQISTSIRPAARAIALALAVGGLSACVEGANPVADVSSAVSGGGSTVGLSPEQRALRERQTAYRNARLQAAGTGAVLGALTGILTDQDTETTVILAAVGAAGGYYAGAQLARQNANFQTQQSLLQRDITNARADTQRLQRSVAAAQSTLDYQQREVARLNAELSRGQVQADAYRARVKTMQGDLQATRTLNSEASRRVQELNTSINQYQAKGNNAAPLRSELTRQQERLRQLQAIESAMISNLNRVPATVRGS
jgi:hypothetical protein